MNLHFKTRLLSFGMATSLIGISLCHEAEARNFRTGLIPNGDVNSCANCHNNPGGGGARNPFGEAVGALVDPGSADAFWSPALAALDSDGDGATNGEELGDPDGDGTPDAGAEVTNPGDPASVPAAGGENFYEQNFDGFANDETDLGDGSIIASNDGTNSVQNGALRLTQVGTATAR